MAEDKKASYFNIVAMTEEWRKQQGSCETKDLLLWQVRAQLAIAQQLSVISGRLEDLLEAVHRSEKR